MSLCDFGTRASRLRAKWTRQRWCAYALQLPAERGDQAGVLVGDDQLHPAQARVPRLRRNAAPEHFVLGVADVDAEDLPAAGGGDPGRDHDGHRGDLRRCRRTWR